ncbi:MAG: hypothetical protein Q9168_003244 [Polycauliona sp. 1 TL-2023]
MGARSQLQPSGLQDRSSSEVTKERASSRKAVADRSRVSTPAFPSTRAPSESEAAFSRPQHTQRLPSTTHAPGHSRLPFHGISSAQPKGRSAFDTDSEAADETTHHSVTTEADNFSFGDKDSVDHRTYPENIVGSYGAPQLSQESLAYHASDHRAANMLPQSEAGSVHYGDDEFDDPTQNENSLHDEKPAFNRHTSVDSTNSASRKRKANPPVSHQIEREQMLGNFSDAPHGAKVSRRLPSEDRPVRSNKTLSISSEEEAFDLESSRHPQSPHPESYLEVIHDNSQELDLRGERSPIRQPMNSYQDTASVKKEYVSELDLDRPINNPRPTEPSIGSRGRKGSIQGEVDKTGGLFKTSTAYPVEEDLQLDYEPETLRKMTYQQLANESFDTAPQPNRHSNGNMSHEGGSPLDEKLLRLHALDGSQQKVHSQRQEFFSSLPIDQYEECGDLMAKHFSQIVSKFQDARQRKRGLAKEFEEEVAARQKLVERRTVAVGEDLDRLKRAGQDVVRRK